YEVVGIEHGRYRVSVSAADVDYDMEHLVRGSGQLDIDVTGSSLRGSVVDASSGAPVAGVDVSLWLLGGRENKPSQSFTTSSRGDFGASSLHEGRYRLVTSKAGYGQQLREIELGRGATGEVVFELAPAEGVSVSVVDARDGRPLDAIVVVRDLTKRIVANRHAGLDADGMLTIPLSAGRYLLSTSASGYGTKTLPIVAPAKGLSVGLTPGGTLVIQSARDLRGRIRLLQPDGEEYVRCWCNGLADIELKGRSTTVANVTPGAYAIELMDDQGTPFGGSSVQIREGETSTVKID
ncbi:MAG: MSCRAMM family protein, partial [Gaiellaceae bacterium]